MKFLFYLVLLTFLFVYQSKAQKKYRAECIPTEKQLNYFMYMRTLSPLRAQLISMSNVRFDSININLSCRPSYFYGSLDVYKIIFYCTHSAIRSLESIESITTKYNYSIKGDSYSAFISNNFSVDYKMLLEWEFQEKLRNIETEKDGINNTLDNFSRITNLDSKTYGNFYNYLQHKME